MKERQRVVVAMSGGVDSAVAAGLLVREGYDVIGITMRLWTLDDPGAPAGKKRCCSRRGRRRRARTPPTCIGIPHYVLNMEREFQERVVDYFVAEYGRGRTPNPCLACNEHVKFRALLDRAIALRRRLPRDGPLRAHRSREAIGCRLLRAVDEQQGPVVRALHARPGRTGAHAVSRRRSRQAGDTRAWPREMGLPVADKPDSADICFVPDGDYRAFVRARLPQHRRRHARRRRQRRRASTTAIAGFTIGQRKGLGAALGERRFVTGIDARANVVTVGTEDDLMSAGFDRGGRQLDRRRADALAAGRDEDPLPHAGRRLPR